MTVGENRSRKSATGWSPRVARIAERSAGPIHFVGHSMGGLVIRALLERMASDPSRPCRDAGDAERGKRDRGLCRRLDAVAA